MPLEFCGIENGCWDADCLGVGALPASSHAVQWHELVWMRKVVQIIFFVCVGTWALA